jgi:uncharacterized Tic20 family protein
MNEPNGTPEDSAVRRVSRLSATASTPAPTQEQQAAQDELVQQDQARYTPKPKGKPRMWGAADNTTLEERNWASLAHLCAWLTLLGGLLSAGILSLVLLFVPLGIYLRFRKKSDYVVFHALQAFTVQLIGTVGALLVLILAAVVWSAGFVLAMLSTFILIGFVLVPLWLIVGVVVAAAVTLMPIAMLVLASIAAWETARGRDYRYPYIARMIDQQLSGRDVSFV